MKKFVVFIFFLLILRCKKDDLEYSLRTPEGLTHWDILKVEGENLVHVNDTLILDVFCPRGSSCDHISQLLSDDYGNRILVKAFGYTNTDSPCLMHAVPQILKYEFIPNKKGLYSLEFIKRDETKIIFSVNVK